MCTGQPVNLVVLDQYMDTCVVSWSSVNSCRAKGLNETSCALMPVFDDVDTVQYQCPFKNETQVSLLATCIVNYGALLLLGCNTHPIANAKQSK